MDTQISTDLSPTTDDLVESFKKLVVNCSADLETLNNFERILSDEISKRSSASDSQSCRSLENDPVSDEDIFNSTMQGQHSQCDQNQEAVKISPLQEIGSDKSHIPLAQSTPIQKSISPIQNIRDAEPLNVSSDIQTEVPNLPFLQELRNGFAVHPNRKQQAEGMISDAQRSFTPGSIPCSLLPNKPFSMFDMASLEKDISFNRIHPNRSTCYFGETPYTYSNTTHSPKPIPKSGSYLNTMLEHLSVILPTFKYNSILITKYNNGKDSVGFHSDAPGMVDGSDIVTICLGQTRNINFKPIDSNSNLHAQTVSACHGDVYTMTHESQKFYQHSVPKDNSTKQRISITLRLLKPDCASQNNTTAHPKHLIIGDSLVNSLRVPGSVSICKGGIRPAELLHLLPGSTDIVHPDSYPHLKTVTVVCGTNALNVKKAGRGMSLLDVVFDYEKLIHDLQTLFPNARIGLYNVIPRAYSCIETPERIQLFNSIFEQHVSNHLKNVFWIRQYSVFLDQWGFLREDLYGRLGIHLKPKGKGIMAKCILNFQRSYN